MEFETQENEAGYSKHLNLHQSKTNMCRCRVNQHLITLTLGSVSINKGLVKKCVKVSQNLGLM